MIRKEETWRGVDNWSRDVVRRGKVETNRLNREGIKERRE